MTGKEWSKVIYCALTCAGLVFFLLVMAFAMQEFKAIMDCREKGGVYVQGFFSGHCFDKGAVLKEERSFH